MPALPGNGASSDQLPAEASAVSLQGRRVYVIDDEIDILKSMRALLGVWGIRVYTAETADSANQLFAEYGPPDLMIVDLRLGGQEHGAQLAHRLQREFGEFPVVIVTGETASAALRDTNEAGYALLQKPIAPEVLHRAIVAAITAHG
jgi:DNA-binding NtrC family response regulator